MKVIAHRGCAEQYPENTISAFEQVADRVDTIEFDVRRCATGELVVFHDELLDRLTGTTGSVGETPWADLQQLTVGDSDQGIPRLGSVIEAIPRDIGLDIELKEPGLSADVLDLLSAEDREVTMTANDPSVIAELARTAPDVPRGFIFWEEPAGGLELARRQGCDVAVVEHRLCLEHGLVEQAHEAGLGVWAWTVTDRATAGDLRTAGVDGLIVDRLDIV